MMKFFPILLGALTGVLFTQVHSGNYTAATFLLLLLTAVILYRGFRTCHIPSNLSERGRLIVAPFLAVLLGICLGMVVVMRSDGSVFQSILIIVAFVFLSLIICFLFIYDRLR